VLQCVAVCCNALQCAAVYCSAAVCCSVLQCIAVCCSVSQHGAMCCSKLHSIAVWYNIVRGYLDGTGGGTTGGAHGAQDAIAVAGGGMDKGRVFHSNIHMCERAIVCVYKVWVSWPWICIVESMLINTCIHACIHQFMCISVCLHL